MGQCACHPVISSDVSVRIPAEAVEKKLKVIGVAKEATEQLQGTLGEITPMLTEIPLDLDPPTLEDSVSDLGTTSIVVYLVDMTDGSVLAATAGHNRQAACGDDVINRMICAEKEGV